MRRLLIVVGMLGLMAASVAAAATPAPDAHDRALARQLAAKVVELQKIATASQNGDDRITRALQGCKGSAKAPAESFAVVFAMLPVLLIDAVNQLRPVLLDVRATIGVMHPHAVLFRRWLAGEHENVDQILAFDNHGKKIDYCAAAKVMLAKDATDAQVQAVLGVPLSRIKALFSATSSAASSRVTKLNPLMRVFLIAAGLRHRMAVQLTN